MTTNKFDSIASIVDYLREPFSIAVNNESTPTKPKSKRLTKKAKVVESYSPSTETEDVIQKLPKGRLRYGPITVNPRKEPSKTLFTGRRSKNEVLSPDEEERRRDRRERNRVAATKCREKRETVLQQLENEYRNEEAKQTELNQLIEDLQSRKNELEIELGQHSDACLMFSNLTNEYHSSTEQSMIFGDMAFLSSIPESRVPPMPLNDPILSYSEEEEQQNTTPVNAEQLLFNSAHSSDDSNLQCRNQDDMIIAFTTSSLERLMISIRSPAQSMDINNANNASSLVNSAQNGTCAQQSGFSEEESLASTVANRAIC